MMHENFHASALKVYLFWVTYGYVSYWCNKKKPWNAVLIKRCLCDSSSKKTAL